jgi:hypothetical protein
MFLCNKCNQAKDETRYRPRYDGRRNLICKDCINKSNSELRARRVEVIGRWKCRKGCELCGYKGHPSALHLDHRDPTTKLHKGSAAYKRWWSWARIKEELAKCRVLCANCHSIESYENKHWLREKRETNQW